jgi:hypothetical protein
MESLDEETARFMDAWMQVRQIVQALNFNRFQGAGLSATQFMTLNVVPAEGMTLSELARMGEEVPVLRQFRAALSCCTSCCSFPAVLSCCRRWAWRRGGLPVVLSCAGLVRPLRLNDLAACT